MQDIMIDLETLGTHQASAFISIGACAFDIETGDIGETFYANIDWDDALKTRNVTGSTIKWWMRQSKEARERVLSSGKPLRPILAKFAKWIMAHGDNSKVWGNGACFDIGMLENAYRGIFDAIPWKHWNVRDVRTIVGLAAGIVTKGDFKFEGTPHNALDDAIHQATYVSGMWQKLREGL